jgi:CHAD domain-containing protein
MKVKARSQFGKEVRRKFLRYTHKKGSKLEKALQAIIDKQDPEAVHEFRKTTRDLQGIIAVCAIRRSSRKVKQIRDALRDGRHALSNARDSDVLLELTKQTQQGPRCVEERADWTTIEHRLKKRRRRTLKMFGKKAKTRIFNHLTSTAREIVKRKTKSEPMTDNLALLLQQGWQKWNAAIDAFHSDPKVATLHAVRIKAKSLRYALNLRQDFYPHTQLEHASRWLKDLQDQIGAWHDELALSRLARSTFAKAPREPHAAKLVQGIKEQEIAMAETARQYLRSLRDTDEYQHLRRLLSAAVFAMADGQPTESPARENITGSLH